MTTAVGPNMTTLMSPSTAPASDARNRQVPPFKRDVPIGLARSSESNGGDRTHTHGTVARTECRPDERTTGQLQERAACSAHRW